MSEPWVTLPSMVGDARLERRKYLVAELRNRRYKGVEVHEVLSFGGAPPDSVEPEVLDAWLDDVCGRWEG